MHSKVLYVFGGFAIMCIFLCLCSFFFRGGKDVIINEETEVLVFDVNKKGEVCTLKQDGVITVTDSEGIRQGMFSDCINFTAICADEKIIYAYDAVEDRIIELSLATGTKSFLSERLFASEVLNIEKISDELYILLVPQDYKETYIDDDYINYSEKLIKLSITQGVQETINCENVLAIYGSEAEKLYAYIYKEDGYGIYAYEPISKEMNCIISLGDDNNRYISSFILEDDIFAYSELDTPGIHLIKIEDEKEIDYVPDVLILSGNELKYSKECLVYYGCQKENESNEFHLVSLNSW